MNFKSGTLFSNLKLENWKNLILVTIICFYILSFFGNYFMYGGIQADYLAFWSVGKIADEKGYSQIYDLNNIKSVQNKALQGLDLITNSNDSTIPLFPVPYFSFFVVPFQFISRIDLIQGYFFWTFINLVILTGYLFFLQRRINPRDESRGSILKLIIIMLISWPVFFNMACGQVEVALLVCAGEFLRSAVGKKPVLAGLWLGGLLLKPQLPIIILPAFLVLREWKVLLGFIASSAMIIMTSFFLSGLAGMQALVSLWTDFSVGMPSNSPGIMINWRMLGFNLNALFNTSLGWVVTGAGMVLTLLAVYLLVRRRPLFGSSSWVVTMLGVFTATLAVTWHSHYHMAMVVIPFLIYAALNKLLPEKVIFLWGVVTPAVLVVLLVIEMLVLVLTKINVAIFNGIVIAFSGFIINLAVFISSLQKRDACDVN